MKYLGLDISRFLTPHDREFSMLTWILFVNLSQVRSRDLRMKRNWSIQSSRINCFSIPCLVNDDVHRTSPWTPRVSIALTSHAVHFHADWSRRALAFPHGLHHGDARPGCIDPPAWIGEQCNRSSGQHDALICVLESSSRIPISHSVASERWKRRRRSYEEDESGDGAVSDGSLTLR